MHMEKVGILFKIKLQQYCFYQIFYWTMNYKEITCLNKLNFYENVKTKSINVVSYRFSLLNWTKYLVS